MNRSFYNFAIFFSGLILALGLIQSLLRFQLGRTLFTMESFVEWFVFGGLLTLVASFILLKYFHHKKYTATFWTFILSIAASLGFFIVVYALLVARRLENFYALTLYMSSGTAILYALSLIFSEAGKRRWLRLAGVFIFLVHAGIIFLFTWMMSAQDIQLNAAVEKIDHWLSFFASLVPVLFILNFLDEQNKLNEENAESAPSKSMEGFLTFTKIIAVIASLFFGIVLISQSLGAIAWKSKELERARKLAEPFEARTYVNNAGDTLLYRLMEPLDYDPQKKYPLVVCLHHGGTHGADNIRQIDGSQPAQKLAQYENKVKYPAFLFVPQCPEGAGWGGVPNYPVIDSLVFDAIAALEQEFSIDEKRRYVTGSSGGGYGSWHFICTRPEMFAAAIPICGGANPALAKNIVDVPVWAFHGEEDRPVPVRFSREMVAAIKTAGGNPKYTEFPGAGHNIWELVDDTPGLLEWLFAQERE